MRRFVREYAKYKKEHLLKAYHYNDKDKTEADRAYIEEQLERVDKVVWYCERQYITEEEAMVEIANI